MGQGHLRRESNTCSKASDERSAVDYLALLFPSAIALLLGSNAVVSQVPVQDAPKSLSAGYPAIKFT
jgi:hypothetical protein